MSHQTRRQKESVSTTALIAGKTAPEQLAPVPATMSNQRRGNGAVDQSAPSSTSMTAKPMNSTNATDSAQVSDRFGMDDLAARFRQLDQVMAKRPIACWPVVRLPQHQHHALQQQHAAMMRHRVLHASMEKIRQTGNARALAEIQRRDQQLLVALQRFAAPADRSLPQSPTATLSPQAEVSAEHAEHVDGESATDDPPLHSAWSMFYDRRGMAVDRRTGNQAHHRHGQQHHNQHSPDQYEDSLVTLNGDGNNIRTVRAFWSHFNQLKVPSASMINSNYHFFRAGIKPLWEDPANARGGKWTLTFASEAVRSARMDDLWLGVLLALIGETLDPADHITGAVFSRRARGDRLAVWLRSGIDAKVAFEIGCRLRDVMRECGAFVDQEVPMEFQLHADSMKVGTSYTRATSCTLDLASLRAAFNAQ